MIVATLSDCAKCFSFPVISRLLASTMPQARHCIRAVQDPQDRDLRLRIGLQPYQMNRPCRRGLHPRCMQTALRPFAWELLGLHRSRSAWGQQAILASGRARLSTMDDLSASTPADAPEPMVAAITAEGIQADDAQEPVDESLPPGPEDACALTLGAQSAGFPLLLPPLVHARPHPSFLPQLRRWRRPRSSPMPCSA
jgi:hypothetical protein